MAKDKVTIMAIEDEALLLEAITRKLTLQNITCISCKTAEEGLAYLKSGKPTPDGIWLDFYLNGGMDGLGFMHEIKKNKKWEKIPVIVVSNSASPTKVKTMIALGVKKYIIKAEKRLDDIIVEMKKYLIQRK